VKHAPLLPCHGIDQEAINQAIQPHVMAKATHFVDWAKAETLVQCDEYNAAAAHIAPDASGETPEEGEVRLDEGGAPR
jgi:hypothetical protein